MIAQQTLAGEMGTKRKKIDPTTGQRLGLAAGQKSLQWLGLAAGQKSLQSSGTRIHDMERMKPQQTKPQTLTNPYLDPKRRADTRGRVMASLQPQITQGVNKVSSLVNPYMKGKKGASLLRDVYQPAQAKLADYELGQEKAGTQYAAEQPYRDAALTGQYGGQETLAGRGTGLAEQQAQFGQGIKTAELTGQYGGQDTLQGRQLAGNLEAQQAGYTGMYGGQQTIQGQTAAGNLAAQQAGLTGQYQGQDTLANRQAQQQYGLNQAQLTGTLGGQQTMAGQDFQSTMADKAAEDKLAQDMNYSSAYEMSLADPKAYQGLISQRRMNKENENPNQSVLYDYAYGDKTGMESNWDGGWTNTGGIAGIGDLDMATAQSRGLAGPWDAGFYEYKRARKV